MANPNKPKPILDILLRNQEKLVDFLSRFHTDRSEDEQFNDEKAYLIKQIKELKPIPSSASGSTSSSYPAGNTYFGSNPGSKTTSIVVSSSGTSHISGESNIGPSCTSIISNTQSGNLTPSEMSSMGASSTISNSINSSCSFSTTAISSGTKDLHSTNSNRHSNVSSSVAINPNISISSSTSNNSFKAPYRGVDDKSVLFD